MLKIINVNTFYGKVCKNSLTKISNFLKYPSYRHLKSNGNLFKNGITMKADQKR